MVLWSLEAAGGQAACDNGTVPISRLHSKAIHWPVGYGNPAPMAQVGRRMPGGSAKPIEDRASLVPTFPWDYFQYALVKIAWGLKGSILF